jgi:hypothetical protein
MLLPLLLCSRMLTSEHVGHNVTALVRNEASLESVTATGGALTIVKGQPQDQADVKKGVRRRGRRHARHRHRDLEQRAHQR